MNALKHNIASISTELPKGNQELIRGCITHFSLKDDN